MWSHLSALVGMFWDAFGCYGIFSRFPKTLQDPSTQGPSMSAQPMDQAKESQREGSWWIKQSKMKEAMDDVHMRRILSGSTLFWVNGDRWRLLQDSFGFSPISNAKWIIKASRSGGFTRILRDPFRISISGSFIQSTSAFPWDPSSTLGPQDSSSTRQRLLILQDRPGSTTARKLR